MKRNPLTAVLVFDLFFFSACSMVYTKFPLSEKSDIEDTEQYEGIWSFEDGVFFIRFDDDKKMQFATVDWKESKFQLETGYVIVTQLENGTYFSLRSIDESDGRQEYMLLKCEMKPGEIIVYLPEAEPFKKAVNDGVLEGTTPESDVILTCTPEKLKEFLKNPDLFGVESTYVFSKIKLEKKSE